jgi:hypothetical protein
MKKIYLSILGLGFAFGVSAQEKALTTKQDLTNGVGVVTPKPAKITEKATVLWSNDFSVPSTWTMTNSSAPISQDWSISTNPGAIPVAALSPFASTTASNGFAFINSDGQAGNSDGNGAIVCSITNATPIDMSTHPAVILRFSHNYRWWQETRTVRVSGNNGATWTDYPMTSAPGGTFTDGTPGDQNTLNPQKEQINISSVAGGASQVLIQFYYNDNDFWGWYWAVDDVEIIEQPANDIQVLGAWFSGSTNEGREYGRTPLTQVDASYNVGAQILNFGTTQQTGIAVNANYTSFVANSSSAAPLPSTDTVFVESVETPALALGVYTGVYTATSVEEPSGADFANNIYPRKFEITSNLYSSDGIGIYPAATTSLGIIGTSNFTGGQDGLVVASMYDIKASTLVSGIRFMLGSNTVAGGNIYGSIKDTASFWADDMTSLFLISNPITVTAAHITAGYADIFFPSEITVPVGAYMVAGELYSNAGLNTISVIDDKTVPQPGTASGIYIPGDASYSNGVALGIRLLVGDQWGVGLDEATLEGVSVYPNPSEGIVNVSVINNEGVSITVYDMMGQVVLTKISEGTTSIDLSANGTGMYLVKVSNNNGSIVERVVIK